MDHSTLEELKCSSSLLQVYICVATAKSYLNLDVLWHLELERKRHAGELDDADDEDTDELSQEEHDGDAVPPVRRFKMRDDNMHRVYLPLTCAVELCDEVRPARLAYIVAGYLADIIPLYVSGLLCCLQSDVVPRLQVAFLAPLLLKYTQDLEMYVSGEHRLSIVSL